MVGCSVEGMGVGATVVGEVVGRRVGVATTGALVVGYKVVGM